MKTLKHLFTALLLLCSITASAHDFEVDGIYYKITNSATKEIAVTYRGNSCGDYYNEYTGSVVIPESVTYGDVVYCVTSIVDHAFYDCRLTSVVIPNSVTIIEDCAFYACYDLASVVIGDGVTSIGNGVFRYCHALTSVVIGNSVTTIGSEAFRECNRLANIEIPNSVTTIGGDAFRETAWYNNQPDGVLYFDKILYQYKGTMPFGTSVVIKEGTTTICSSAFNGCSGLTSVEIPNSITTIGRDAFNGCSGLASVEIPNSVTSIGDYAFNGCSGLTGIEIPNSVTTIGSDAFNGCISLKELCIEDGVSTLSL